MPSVPKHKRNENAKLRAWIKTLPCVVCGQYDESGKCDPSHIKSRGARGGDEENLLPMTRLCHRWFEDLPAKTKQRLLMMAIQYTVNFRNDLTPPNAPIGRGWAE